MTDPIVPGLHPEIAADSPALLHQVHGRRGYALSYHRMFQAHAPALLEAYDAYYQELTLRPRALSDQAKETVWIALQAATREGHGMIHLKRAEAAGLSPFEAAGRLVALRGNPYVSLAPIDLTPGRDVIFYQPFDRGSVLRLVPGLAAVYFPPDAHLGCIAPGAPALVRKVVVKVPVPA